MNKERVLPGNPACDCWRGRIQLATERCSSVWRKSISVIGTQRNSDSGLFVRRVGATFSVRVALIAIGVITSVMVARLLGPEARGVYVAAVVLASIGSQFGAVGLQTANTYYVATDRSLLPALISNSLCAALICGGGASVLMLLLFRLRPEWAPVSGTVLHLVLLLIPTTLGAMLVQNLLLGVQEVKWFNLVDVAGRVTFVAVCGLSAVLLGRVRTEHVVWIALLAALLTGLLATGRLWHLVARLPLPDRALLRRQASYGVRSYITCLSAYAVLKIDVLMVKWMAGNAAAGYYSLASSMADFLYTFPAVVGMMLFPALSGTGDSWQRWRRAKKTMIAVTAIMGATALSAALVAKPLTRFAYGDEFLPTVPAFLILCVAIVFYGANNVVSAYFSSCGQPWCSVWVWPVAAVLNIGLNLYFIRTWGIAGASTSSLITYSALLAAQCVLPRVGLRRFQPAA